MPGVIKKEHVIKKPFPHVLRKTSKQIHGWYHPRDPYGRRDCTSERLLINPYNGCSHDCIFCYSKAYFPNRDYIVVCKDYDIEVAKQLDSIDIASCGYLSPVTDPFQPLDEVYHLSEKIIKVFVERNLPIEFVTKGRVPQDVLEIMKEQKHSFGQVSIITLRKDLHRQLVPGGPPPGVLLNNLERMREARIYPVCRIDPVIPGLTDNLTEIEALMESAKKAGAKHIIASCLDIPKQLSTSIISSLSSIYPPLKEQYEKLYSETIGGYLHANKNYRYKLFSLLGWIAKKLGLTFALCMEFGYTRRKYRGKPVLEGLNKYYMTSRVCEGKEVPIYFRDGDKFFPLAGCTGGCLTCRAPVCNIPELPTGGAWRLSDYRLWSRRLRENRTGKIG
ncbi:MAG: radical SAM protein [Candidatus Eremiobacteraeota bacterium]|nr:radical SAM protein [Candidatus Eremiobacteraeota bacterium]